MARYAVPLLTALVTTAFSASALRARLLAPLRILLDACLPPACLACDGPTGEARPTLCPRCEESVASVEVDGLVAAAAFGGALADAVRRAKFRPDAVTAAALGSWWVARIEAGRAPSLPPIDGVTFVPAPWRRRVQRGFDVPALLADTLARAHGLPVVDALACQRTDPPLSHGADKAARAVAVSGRYCARRSFAGRTLLLVDDVHTTGATLGEARRALEAAGAAVVPAALAVAP